MKTCPTGCGRKPRSGCYLCTECWYALPREQRREFNRVYRVYQISHATNRGNAKAHAIAVEQYRRIRGEAVTAARRLLRQPEARA